MNFHLSLIICTYKRAESLAKLLKTLGDQTCYPNDIIIVDGSPDDFTKTLIAQTHYPDLRYHKVEPHERGLTKQRNIGVGLCDKNTDIVAFLDDDTELFNDYFEELIKVYQSNPEITGVGGVAVNENRWVKISKNQEHKNCFIIDDFKIKLSSRYRFRKMLGLMSKLPPGKMPKFSHGNTQSYPLSGNCYEVDLIVGMSMSFRTKIVHNQKFSEYFEGYGLYEDADYSIRALEYGKNVIATSVKLNHHHHPSGRPNQFKYGQMVVRNGWYVWRTRWPNPGFKNILKWHANVLLLTTLRFLNVLTTKQKKQALTEAFGRLTAWSKLFFITPKFNN
jgi:GT2 family glycosyltransferase